MKLFFYGADKEVTGSCHMLEVSGKRILIDCGLQQGSDERNNNELPFSPRGIDAVLVTHAHIDHSGRLPLLVKNGYRGPIYATRATCDLLRIMLLDSAHIQETDAEWRRRKEKRAGREPKAPLYTTEDAAATLQYLVACEYETSIAVTENVKAEFIDAGHLLGSASVVCEIEEGQARKKIVFSGDIGSKHQPIIRDPQYIQAADYVVMESTYGNRLHESGRYGARDLSWIIEETLDRGGNVVIPAFAVGRTQELLYYIREIKEKGLVKNHPDFPVYVDSPLALEATHIYDGDLTGYADAETLEILAKGFQPIRFDRLFLCKTMEESIALNEDKTPKVIISASGMCEAGRIRHHLKHNLWRPECSVLFVGYQANGTLGRMLVDGVPRVKLFGEEIAVNAKIFNVRGMSAHADKMGLLEWIEAFQAPLQKVFVVHGEEEAAMSFTQELRQLGKNALAPDFKMIYDLATDECLEKGIAIDVLRNKEEKQGQSSEAYRRLLAMGEKMMETIRRNQGGSNKDLGKFADQLRSLTEKWER